MPATNDLLEAIHEKQWDKVRTLLRSEKSQNLVEHVGVNGRNALHWACLPYANFEYVPLDIIQLILSASPTKVPCQQDDNGNTPLHLAVQVSNYEAIVVLIETCPRAATVVNHQRCTPFNQSMCGNNGDILHYMLRHKKSPSAIRHLLIAHPSAVTDTGKNSYTPLHVFFYTWSSAMKNRLDSIPREQQSIHDLVVRNISHEEEKIGAIYGKTRLLLQAVVCNKIIEDDDRSTTSPFRALHAAILTFQCPSSFCDMILRMNPKQAYRSDEDGNFPIHIASSTKSSFDGELYECEQCGAKFKESSWYEHEDFGMKCRECLDDSSLDDDEREELVHVTSVDKISVVIAGLLETNSDFASLPGRNDKLPLHIAIEYGKSFVDNEIQTMYHAAPRALSTRSIVNHLYPFMLSATVVRKGNPPKKKKEDHPSNEHLQRFTCCFALLLENPVLVQSGILKGRNEDVDDDVNS